MSDHWRSLHRNLFLVLALASLFLAGAMEKARAQDPFSDFFGGLFGGQRHTYGPRESSRPYYRYEPRVRRLMPHRNYGAPAYWHGERTNKAKAKKPDETGAPVEQAENSFTVLVIGDSLGQMLANGLDEAFEEKQEIVIKHKDKENSGLVREDFFDWPRSVNELLSQPGKIDVAVMMVGSNDRQAIRDGDEMREPLSARWRELYGARVDAIANAFKEKNIPLIWVGLPIAKSERFSADMAKLNEIYRDHVTRSGAVYIDIWEAFGDEHNQYQAFGPDVNGQIVKLRSADGIHFTEAGSRKLAHFVEGEIKRLFEARRQPGEAELPNGQESPPPSEGTQPATAVTPNFVNPAAPHTSSAPVLPERPAIGPVQSLNAPGPQADGDLARRQPSKEQAEAAAKAARALVNHVFVDGREPPSRQGRSDDFSWRPADSAPQ